jgi:hypothetical protein
VFRLSLRFNKKSNNAPYHYALFDNELILPENKVHLGKIPFPQIFYYYNYNKNSWNLKDIDNTKPNSTSLTLEHSIYELLESSNFWVSYMDGNILKMLNALYNKATTYELDANNFGLKYFKRSSTYLDTKENKNNDKKENKKESKKNKKQKIEEHEILGTEDVVVDNSNIINFLNDNYKVINNLKSLNRYYGFNSEKQEKLKNKSFFRQNKLDLSKKIIDGEVELNLLLNSIKTSNLLQDKSNNYVLDQIKSFIKNIQIYDNNANNLSNDKEIIKNLQRISPYFIHINNNSTLDLFKVRF